MNRGQRRARWLALHRATHRGMPAAAIDSAIAVRAQGAASDVHDVQPRASSVQLHIEELVLHGFPPGSRYSIGESTREELARLLTERGVPRRMVQPGETPLIDAGRFQVAASARPHEIGALVANAVYGRPKR